MLFKRSLPQENTVKFYFPLDLERTIVPLAIRLRPPAVQIEVYDIFGTPCTSLRCSITSCALAHKLPLLNNNERWRASNQAIHSCSRQESSLPVMRGETRECDFTTALIYTTRDVGVRPPRDRRRVEAVEGKRVCNMLRFISHYFPCAW